MKLQYMKGEGGGGSKENRRRREENVLNQVCNSEWKQDLL